MSFSGMSHRKVILAFSHNVHKNKYKSVQCIKSQIDHKDSGDGWL